MNSQLKLSALKDLLFFVIAKKDDKKLNITLQLGPNSTVLSRKVDIVRHYCFTYYFAIDIVT